MSLALLDLDPLSLIFGLSATKRHAGVICAVQNLLSCYRPAWRSPGLCTIKYIGHDLPGTVEMTSTIVVKGYIIRHVALVTDLAVSLPSEADSSS